MCSLLDNKINRYLVNIIRDYLIYIDSETYLLKLEFEKETDIIRYQLDENVVLDYMNPGWIHCNYFNNYRYRKSVYWYIVEN